MASLLDWGIKMITSFGLSNYKSYGKEIAKIPLSELTVLIGANASGKSNIIEAFQLLSWVAHGRRLGDLPHAIEKHEVHLRGSLDDLLNDKDNPLKYICEIEILNDRQIFEISIGLSEGSLQVVDEELVKTSDSNFPLYRIEGGAFPGGSDIQVAYNNFARGGKKPQITCTNQQAIFTQLQTPARFGKSHSESQKRIPQSAIAIQKSLERIHFLDPVPSAMRDYAFPSDKVLRDDGSNVSSVLYNCCGENGAGDLVLDFVSQLPEQDVHKIDFLKGPRGEVMVRLEESFGHSSRFCDAALLSDGTLRVLAIAAALLSLPEKSVLVIEEIDNGVHPSRAENLLRKIQNTARKRQLRVLLTTHNPAMLDALPSDTIPDTIFCYRDTDSGLSRLTRLEDLPDYPALIAQGSLGDLLTERVLERYIKNPPTDLVRQANTKRLMESLGIVESGGGE